MIRIRSKLEKAENMVSFINNETSFSAKILGFLSECAFAPGFTILIKKSFFKRIKIIFDGENLCFYPFEGKMSNLSKEIISKLEEITNQEVLICDYRKLTLGGR